MENISLINNYVVCPFCKSGVTTIDKRLECEKCNKEIGLVHDGIINIKAIPNSGNSFSEGKWDEIYLTDYSLKEAELEYKKIYLDDTKRQVLQYLKKITNRPKTYLEIGCGQAFLGEELANDGWIFIGMDYSSNALKSLKKRLNDRGIKNYFLIKGDIQFLPIKSNSIDLVFGGGVIEHIEHIKNTQIVINNIFRVLTQSGVSFNTVPYFNLGNLFYRSLWGGVPNIPILRELSELLHIKILKGKHMVFGYELQFTKTQIKK